MRKVCKICNIDKDIDCFYRNAAKCKSCILSLSKQKTINKRQVIIDLPGEEWRPTVQHPDYFVSNKSRIKAKEKRYSNGKGTESIRGECLISGTFSKGYVVVEIYDKNYLWHRVVAMAWIPNPENKPYINHINGIKSDNRILNLEWCTQSENAKHSFRIGTQNNKGVNHPRALFTNEQVIKIKEMLRKKIKGRVIAELFHVHESTISKIKVGKHWNYQELQSI